MSALLPRNTVNEMLKNIKVDQHLSYLRDSEIPDESLWATITGNKKGLFY